MQFNCVLYQVLLTPGERRTFFRRFQSGLPPQIGWKIQVHEWDEAGRVVENVFVNAHGVCFVGLQGIVVDAEMKAVAEMKAEYLEDFKHWVDDSANPAVDHWRQTIDKF